MGRVYDSDLVSDHDACKPINLKVTIYMLLWTGYMQCIYVLILCICSAMFLSNLKWQGYLIYGGFEIERQNQKVKKITVG